MTDNFDLAATDDIWKRDEVQSPCVKICVIHPAQEICVGCGRTRHEIAGWSRYDNAARAAVTAALPDRMKKLTDGSHRPSRRRKRQSSVPKL